MDLITFFNIYKDVLRNIIWPEISEITIKEFKGDTYKFNGYSYVKQDLLNISALNIISGTKQLFNLRLVCKEFKTTFTNDFYWEKIFKFDSTLFLTNKYIEEYSLCKPPEKFYNFINTILIIGFIKENFLERIISYRCNLETQKRIYFSLFKTDEQSHHRSKRSVEQSHRRSKRKKY